GPEGRSGGHPGGLHLHAGAVQPRDRLPGVAALDVRQRGQPADRRRLDAGDLSGRMAGEFFEFEPFDREIEKKLVSLERDPAELMQALLAAAAERGLGERERTRLRRLFDELAALPFDTIYEGYLTHLVRVTGSYLPFLEEPTYEEL